MARPTVYDDTLRARLVQCAAAAIAGAGVEALSVRKVATCAETSTSAIYTLIGNRGDLINAVMGETITSFLDSQEAVKPTDDPVADLADLGRAYRNWALDNQDMYQLLFGARLVGAGLGPTGLDQLEAGVQALVEVLERGMEAGVFRRTDPAAHIALLLWTVVHGFVSLEMAQWTQIPRHERDALFEVSIGSQTAHWLVAPT